MELDDKTSKPTMSNVIADSNNHLAEIYGNLNEESIDFIRQCPWTSDIIRIIGQDLVNMGLYQTVDTLLKESGVNRIDHPVASKFQQYVIAGEWQKADSIVEELSNHSEGDKKSNLNEMKLLIAEQKFLELIEDNQHIKALKCLRLEITPLTENTKRIQLLATLLMCRTIGEVKIRVNWAGKGIGSRRRLLEKFQRFIPPKIMLPPRRLRTLLEQAQNYQQEKCNFHIPIDQVIYDGFYITDHNCSANDFPLHPRQELDSHKAEVWFCKFSNDGEKLATGGLGGRVKIWNVDRVAKKLIERCTFDCNCNSITCLSWSPDDVYILACGSEDRPDLWIWNVLKEEVRTVISHSDEESITTCSWHLNGEKFAAASIKGNFNIYDLDGNRKGNREGVRVQCLSFLNLDPSVILAADNLNRIKSYAVSHMSQETDEEDVLKEKYPIMSFTIDMNDRYIAVNLLEQGIHLWDYKLKTLLRMFPGVCQRHFTIYSSFSTIGRSTFLASGSEDGKVYIYNILKEQPIAVLHGHSRCVNCVSWNPAYPELLVSVSDDRIVKLWAPLRWNSSKDEKTGT